MGFHLEEASIADGSIDNRTKGKTLLRFNFTDHTSSLITLQGNPCRDLAGALWVFRNPHAVMDDAPGEQCFFIPALCEGTVGRITHTRRSQVPILPPDEHYDRLYDDNQEDPPTKTAPVLDLEWFSQKFKQVEIDCEQMVLELVEMAWTLSPEEAAAGEAAVEETREEFQRASEESMEAFYDEMELLDEYIAGDPEPHELEELCFLIVQHFVIHTADGSDEKQDLHIHLLKLQEQISGAFIHHALEDEFANIPETISLLTSVLPFIDRAAASAKTVTDATVENLGDLREGIIRLREKLTRSLRR